jgi:BirA family biotin operon repressor/biotin-[acetyl-CoA-carboxylase] ligase
MRIDALLQRLADGEIHSGEALAAALGVTRAAVWKQTARLADYGLEIEAAAGRGYRLAAPLDLLDGARIAAALDADTTRQLGALELHLELDSTNRYLLERAAPAPGRLDVAIAEFQHAGRGRRGRGWTAPLGGGLCLSVAWHFADLPPDLSALSLAVGVAARRAICALTPIDLGLKWPNDLVHAERKLGGILVELNAEAQGGCHVVAGLGINVAVPEAQLAAVSNWRHGAVDLRLAAGAPPPRALLAARVIDELAGLFSGYAETGFGPYAAEWEACNVLRGRPVQLEEAAGVSYGIAGGIEPDGALILEAEDGSRRRVISGDVSLRPLA